MVYSLLLVSESRAKKTMFIKIWTLRSTEVKYILYVTPDICPCHVGYNYIIPPYAYKLNCAILLVKSKEIGYDSFHFSLWDNSSCTWADSTVVLSAKVNCCPWGKTENCTVLSYY